jgi:hypothetical protein
MRMNISFRLSIILSVLISSLPISGFSVGTKTDLDYQDQPGVRLLRSDRQGVLVDLYSPDYQIENIIVNGDSFQEISVPNYELASNPGQFRMPVASILLGVPPQADIKIHVVDDVAESITKQLNLRRSLATQPIMQEFQSGLLSQSNPPLTSQEDLFYPNVPARIAGEAWVRDQRIVRVELNPFQYNPATSQLLWHKRLQVEVAFESGSGEVDSSKNLSLKQAKAASPDFDAALRDTLLNYQAAQEWRGIPRSMLGASNQFPEFGDTRYKITVDRDGIYELTYNQLNNVHSLGITLDVSKIHLSSQGHDVAITVKDQGNDGQFGPGDSIKFYGQKFTGNLLAPVYAGENANWTNYSPETPEGCCDLWQPEFNAEMMEKYTDENVYWLTLGKTDGLIMDTIPGEPVSSAQAPQFFTDTVHAEQSHEWFTFHFTSEDTWFWDRLNVTNPTTRTYTTTLSSLVTEPMTATIRGELVARRNSIYDVDHHTPIYINDRSIAINENESTWNGISRYPFEANIPQSDLKEGENQLKLSVLLDAYPSQFSDDIYFDWFEIQYARRFEALDDQLRFSFDEGGQIWNYQVDGFTSSEVEVFDITDPLQPVHIIGGEPLTNGISFESSHPGQRDYYLVGNGSVIKDPAGLTFYTPPNWSSMTSGADYVFITHEKFLGGIQSLATYRQAQGLSTKVIDVEDLYNEFNYGIFNPIAIKNFLTYTFANWQTPPTYVLLVGDGHWNFKNYQSNISGIDYSSPTPIYMPPNLSWVDPWQGEVDSANLLATIVNSPENPDPLPDVNIGRLPVNNVNELQAFIDKIKTYESASLEDWWYRLIFIADGDNDPAGDFAQLAEDIIAQIPPAYSSERIYKSDYASGSAVKDAILNALNSNAAAFVNFIGHGSIEQWSKGNPGGIFSVQDIASINNSSRLPVLLSMDCLDGYWLYPGQSGLVEELVRAESKGVVSAFAPTGLGVATGHDALQRGFYQAVFQGDIKLFGPAVLAGKLALYKTGHNFDLLHTFTIFGDPALKLQIPARPLYLPLIVSPSS